jgi:hypothetical protein
MRRFDLLAACGALASAVLAIPLHAAASPAWVHADPASNSVSFDIAMGAERLQRVARASRLWTANTIVQLL